jgi:argininosuccinate synthase
MTKLNGSKTKVNKVVLAYSGGLDTSVILPWLIENYGCEVICYTADVGQGAELGGLEEKAFACGASKIIIEDLQEQFASDYLFPYIRSGAVYEGKYLLGTSVARPLIAKRQAEIALQEGADAVAHGCTGKGNDQVRFELTFMAVGPNLKVIAPWREWSITSREDALDYAAAHNIPVTSTIKSIYSRDANLWHLSHEGGILENPWAEPEEEMYQMSNSPESAPDQAQMVEIEFVKGYPVALDGKKLSPMNIIKSLNQIGGLHGIGRVDLVENRLVGMKSHGVYETPGGTILMAAHKELESITLDRDTAHYKELVSSRYAELVYNGLWFTPLKDALDAFIDKTQETVTGSVRLKLYKGNVISAGRQSPYSLYREDFATFGYASTYSHSDAQGFINLFGLPMKVKAMVGIAPEVHEVEPSTIIRD